MSTSHAVKQETEYSVQTALSELESAKKFLADDHPDPDDGMYDRAEWHMETATALLNHVIFHLHEAGKYTENDEDPRLALAQCIYLGGEGTVSFDTVGHLGPMLFTTFKIKE